MREIEKLRADLAEVAGILSPTPRPPYQAVMPDIRRALSSWINAQNAIRELPLPERAKAMAADRLNTVLFQRARYRNPLTRAAWERFVEKVRKEPCVWSPEETCEDFDAEAYRAECERAILEAGNAGN